MIIPGIILFTSIALSLHAQTMEVSTSLPAKAESVTRANPAENLDCFILTSQQTLETAQKLQSTIQNYLRLQNHYIENPNDRECCYQMVKAAGSIMDQIDAAYLHQLFEPDFIKELSFFAQMAKKRGVPQP